MPERISPGRLSEDGESFARPPIDPIAQQLALTGGPATVTTIETFEYDALGKVLPCIDAGAMPVGQPNPTNTTSASCRIESFNASASILIGAHRQAAMKYDRPGWLRPRRPSENG